MNTQQLTAVRDAETIAAVITTRNATFWLVDSSGAATDKARYSVEQWDDVNGLLYLKAGPGTSNQQLRTRMVINYDIIDELIVLEK